MGLGTVQTLSGIVAGAVVLCVATVAALAGPPAGGNAEVVISTIEQSDGASSDVTTEVVVQNQRRDTAAATTGAVVQTGRFGELTPDPQTAVSRVVRGGTASADVARHVTVISNSHLSMQTLKSDGKIITYAAAVFSTKPVKETHSVNVQDSNSGREKTRSEKRTRTVYATTSSGKKRDVPLPKGTMFETLDGTKLTEQAIIDRDW